MCKIFFRIIVSSVVLWMGMGSSMAETKTLKDPTEPQSNSNAAKSMANPVKDFQLSAIFISQSERHAVINDKVVKKGDIIGNKLVQAIDPYTVTLMDNGKERVLYLLGTETSIKGQAK